MTPAVAPRELVNPAVFDFTNMSNARVGINRIGVDYPARSWRVADNDQHRRRRQQIGHFHSSALAGTDRRRDVRRRHSVPGPPGSALQLSVGIDDGATCTDGVTFRVTAGGTELWHQNFNLGTWHDVVLSLAAYAGSTVPIRLISNPGPAANPNCDWAGWSEVALVAPTSAISVPLSLASAAIFSGIDGASYTPYFGIDGHRLTNAAIPGGFTIFTQPGPAVASGTNLATLAFDVWQWANDGSPPKPGSVFNAGTVLERDFQRGDGRIPLSLLITRRTRAGRSCRGRCGRQQILFNSAGARGSSTAPTATTASPSQSASTDCPTGR